MKTMKVLFFAVAMTLSGAFAPVFAAPSVAQVHQFLESQAPTDDEAVQNAQQAFALASMQYAIDKMENKLNETEKQIDQLMESEELAQSIEQTVQSVIPADIFDGITTEEELQAKLEQLQNDPQLETKLINAYHQNKYITQLSALFFENQDEYKAGDIDQDTFDKLIVAFVNMSLSMKQMLQGAQ